MSDTGESTELQSPHNQNATKGGLPAWVKFGCFPVLGLIIVITIAGILLIPTIRQAITDAKSGHGPLARLDSIARATESRRRAGKSLGVSKDRIVAVLGDAFEFHPSGLDSGLYIGKSMDSSVCAVELKGPVSDITSALFSVSTIDGADGDLGGQHLGVFLNAIDGRATQWAHSIMTTTNRLSADTVIDNRQYTYRLLGTGDSVVVSIEIYPHAE